MTCLFFLEEIVYLLEEKREPEKKRTASGKKVPAGAVSIFGGMFVYSQFFH